MAHSMLEGLTNNNNSKPQIVQSNLHHGLKHLFRIGQFIGLIPMSSILNITNLKFQWKSTSTVCMIIIIISLTINTIVGIIGFFSTNWTSAKELTWSFHMAGFYGTGVFLYIYFLYYAKALVQMFQKIEQLELQLVHRLMDTSFVRVANLATWIIFISMVLENLTWHFKHSFSGESTKWADSSQKGSAEQKSNQSFLEAFYQTSEPSWSDRVPYNAYLTIFIIVSNKLALYSWNFAEILIIILSRWIYFKFKFLNEVGLLYITEQNLEKKGFSDFGKQNLFVDKALYAKWNTLIHDHKILTFMTEELNSFLSPLIFQCFCHDVYSVSIHISLTLSTNSETSLIESIYSTWAFLHMVIRFCLVGWTTANVHLYGTEFRKILRNCPSSVYGTIEISKYDNQLTNSYIGFDGMGYFKLTKPVLLKVINVVFTVEIVLLQQTYLQ